MECLFVSCLYCRNRNYPNYILSEASSRQIVDGSCDTLHNGAVSFCLSESLNELVSDIACIEVREYENVSLACYR